MISKPKKSHCVFFAGTLCAAVLPWTPAWGADGGAAAVLDPVLVTASPVDNLSSEAMRSVEVITQADIQASAATNLADLLAQTNGVMIRRRGAPGVQADVGIRGSNFEQTLVLVDGMPIHNPQTGHHNLNVPVPLAHIQRIEIIKGPGALQYGGDATGGVINIITRHPQAFEAGVTVMGGSHHSRQLSAHLGGGDERVSQLLSASVAHTDGEDAERPTDADVKRVLYTGHAVLPNVQLGWGLGVSSKDYGAWGFYSDVFPDARERIHSRMAWGTAKFALGDWQLGTDVYWRGYQDRFSTLIGDGQFINRHDTDVVGVKGDARRPDAHGVTAMGVDFRHASIDSNALDDHRRDQTSLWLMRRQQLSDAWRLELGLNHVDYSDYGSYWLPSAALSWQFSPHWHAFVSAARSARVPSYTELYLDTAANRGNPALGPERSDASEIGVAGHLDKQKFKATLFQRRNDTLIDWTRQPGESAWQAENFSGYRARGMELSWRWQPDLRWLQMLGLTWERMLVEVDSHDEPVTYARQVPDHTLGMQLRVPLTDRISFSMNARRPTYARQDTVTLAGMKLSWIGERMHVSLEGNNLLDKRIVESGFAPIAGRWVYVTMGMDF